MKPIGFACRLDLPMSPEAICQEIFTLEHWPGFTGYGLLPGIRAAEFQQRRDELVGTRIAVTNRDGSTHVEEVVAWDGSSRLLMRLGEFSPPLSKLAEHFEEEWHFEPLGSGHTRVTRGFRLYALNPAGRLALRLIARLLQKAVNRHLHSMLPQPG